MSELAQYLDSERRDNLVEFLREQRPTLLALCKRWCGGNSADADDLLGEACLRAFEALSGMQRDLQSPLGWWATIIANAARDRARKHTRRSRVSAEIAEVWASGAPGREAWVDERLSIRRGLARVNAKMSMLSRSQQLALTWRSFGDEYDEIAQKLGTSNGNARKLVQVGRQLLRADCGQVVADYLPRAVA